MCVCVCVCVCVWAGGNCECKSSVCVLCGVVEAIVGTGPCQSGRTPYSDSDVYTIHCVCIQCCRVQRYLCVNSHSLFVADETCLSSISLSAPHTSQIKPLSVVV